MTRLVPGNTEFAIVSFEGPDEYARAGGLAVRVRDLSETLAAAGFQTHLYFVGDPGLPGEERRDNLTLHRWVQWISAHHPGGVYDGEWGKMEDMTQSLPPHLVENIVVAAAGGRTTVLMTEDWQTGGVAIAVSRLAAERGALRHLIPVWTANNVFGFGGINWRALQEAANLMTVSRYMKHQMWDWGVNPLVVPNGVAPAAIVDVPAATARRLRKAFGSQIALFKIGRFSPDKRWLMALEAVAILKGLGISTRILIRGDRSPYGQEVLSRAHYAGLTIVDLDGRYETVDDLAEAISSRPEADILNLTRFLPDHLVPVIYAAVDGVLANSGHEPFGLVGLEVMGAGGLAFVGSTGEEYAEPNRNAIVLDTDDPREIVAQLQRLMEQPAESQEQPKAARAGSTGRGGPKWPPSSTSTLQSPKSRYLRQNGKATARACLWSEVLHELLTKLEYVALARGVTVPT